MTRIREEDCGPDTHLGAKEGLLEVSRMGLYIAAATYGYTMTGIGYKST